MYDPQQNSSRPLISITPRKKSVRFNISTPSPRIPKLQNQNDSNSNHHPLNVSYTIPSTTVNIDHITNQSHLQHLNNQTEYIPTTRRNNLQINGEKIQPPPKTLDELQQFMKTKAENLRRNMTQVATTFNQASAHLNRIKEEQQTVLQRPSRIPVSTRYRSPSPTTVVYRKPHHRSLDDLRWYCLARKFSILWQKRVFGCHLRRIKAIYHRKLLERYFRLWRTDKYESIAIDFHEQYLLKSHFQTWLHFALDSQIATEHRNQKRLQQAWTIWKLQLNKRRLHQQQYQIAHRHYDKKVLSHFYHIWRINSHQRRQEQDQGIRANYYHRVHLERNCFSAWLTYVVYRRKKNAHKKRVHDYYQKHLVGQVYAAWKQALTRRLLIQQHQHRLAQLQERVLLRWAFEQWRSYLCDLADEHRTMQMVEQYSDRRIMRSALTTFRRYALHRRMKQRLNWSAVQHQARILERTYYRIWKHRLEQRENIYMHAEFNKAESFYHMKVTIRHWFCWRRYVNDCRQEHARIDAAATYHNAKLIRKYFNLLRSNIDDERYEKRLEKQADDFYRLRYLRLYYMYWKEQTRTQEQFQMNWRMAIFHEENTRRRRIFNTWLDRAHSKLIDNEQHIVAERHYFRAMMTRAWLVWRQLIDERHSEERYERIAIQFYYHTIQRRTINAWKLYILHCRRMKLLYHEGEQFHLHHRGRTLFYSWLQRAQQKRRLMMVVNERFNRHQRVLLRQYFRQWRDHAHEEKDNRQLTQYAVDHYNRSLKRKVLLAWNNEMVQQVLIDNENEMKLNRYRDDKTHYHVQKLYNIWKQTTHVRQHDRFLEQRSNMFYERNLLRKSFFQWRQQHQFNMRIKLLERQAVWFDRMRVVSRIYLQWKQTWQLEHRLDEQKHRALLFWALQLQKKCIVKWLIYLGERKRKKARYNAATHQRHDELIRNCLRQFLVYTDHTKQRRQALFIHQQVYLYHDRNALAAKYAAKWRAYVKVSLARKQQTQHLIKRNTATTIVPVLNNPLDLVRFDSSPPKITNRPRPRKPDFLSDSFSTSNIKRSEHELPRIDLHTSPSPPLQPLPTIDHSLHSPFVTVKQTINTRSDISSPSVQPQPSVPVLLPPSAFQINPSEVQMPLSSRRTSETKVRISHRPYSAQPSTTTLSVNKDNLLHVKERLEIYLNNKAKLKRLRQQLASLTPLQSDPQLEQECQQLSAYIASEKIHLTSILQNL